MTTPISMALFTPSLAAAYRVSGMAPGPCDLQGIYQEYGQELLALEQTLRLGPHGFFGAYSYAKAYYQLQNMRADLGPALEPIVRLCLGDTTAELRTLRIDLELNVKLPDGREGTMKVHVPDMTRQDDVFSRLYRAMLLEWEALPEGPRKKQLVDMLTLATAVSPGYGVTQSSCVHVESNERGGRFAEALRRETVWLIGPA